MTPNYALGANCALESVVVMANEINALHKRSLARKQRPTREEIIASFQRYEEARKPRQKLAFDASYQLTRMQTCDGLLNHIKMMYLVPILGFSVFADSLANLCAGAPKFDFLPYKNKRPATVKWKDEDEVVEEKASLKLQKIGAAGAQLRNPWGVLFGASMATLISLVLLVWNMLRPEIALVVS